ncbi:MAG: PorT family protein [Paludibacteraceae bacterium]|nr:PorT family protein [Paludibacteraceae bacterium]
MKKQFLALALMLLSASAIVAQDAAQSFGLSVGYANPIFREKSASTATKLDGKITTYGFMAGAVYEANLIKGFGLHLELNYGFSMKEGKWAKLNSSGADYPRQKSTYTTHYFDMPIQWQYKFEIAKETYLLLYTGPALQVHFTMSEHNYLQSLPNASIEEKISNYVSKTYDRDGDGKYDYNRINVNWGIGAGFQYQRYYLRGGYDFGISNPYHDRFFDISAAPDAAWKRQGRRDQWFIKLGIYLWQH